MQIGGLSSGAKSAFANVFQTSTMDVLGHIFMMRTRKKCRHATDHSEALLVGMHSDMNFVRVSFPLGSLGSNTNFMAAVSWCLRMCLLPLRPKDHERVVVIFVIAPGITTVVVMAAESSGRSDR